MDGNAVTVADLQGNYGGKDFTLKFGDHEMAFASAGGDAVSLTINGKTSESLNGAVHLNLNDMAVCIGDKCLMWSA